MKKSNWSYISIGFLVLCLLGYVVFAVVKFSKESDTQECSGTIIRIMDENQRQFISKGDIDKILTKNHISFQGKQAEQIDCKTIEDCIKKNPVVREVHCYKTPSGTVKIDVWQRTPIMRVMGTTNYYVDDEGEVIPISPNVTAYVPIVTGNVNKKFAVEEISKFVVYLQNNKFWNSQIEQIHVDKNNEILLIPRVGDHEIILGKLDGFELKMEKLRKFYNDGLAKIGWGDYKTINLKYKNQVVCTKK